MKCVTCRKQAAGCGRCAPCRDPGGYARECQADECLACAEGRAAAMTKVMAVVRERALEAPVGARVACPVCGEAVLRTRSGLRAHVAPADRARGKRGPAYGCPGLMTMGGA